MRLPLLLSFLVAGIAVWLMMSDTNSVKMWGSALLIAVPAAWSLWLAGGNKEP